MGKGIDHGLGGKDNKRSQEKRAKKAMRQSIFAKAALQGGKKKEIIFDENARIGKIENTSLHFVFIYLLFISFLYIYE